MSSEPGAGRASWVLRRATPEDAEDLRDLLVAVYGESYVNPSIYDLRVHRRILSSPDQRVLVASQRGSSAILGTGAIDLGLDPASGDIAMTRRFAVAPRFRGTGCGSLLKRRLLAEASGNRLWTLSLAGIDNLATQTINLRCRHVALGYLPLWTIGSSSHSYLLMGRPEHRAWALRRPPPPPPDARIRELAERVLAACGVERDRWFDSTASPLSLGDALNPLRLADEIAAPEGTQVPSGCEHGEVNYATNRLHGRSQIWSISARTPEELAGCVRHAVELGRSQTWRWLFAVVKASSTVALNGLLCGGLIPVAYLPASGRHPAGREDLVMMAKLFEPASAGYPVAHPELEDFVDFVGRQLGPAARRPFSAGRAEYPSS